ncbi:membrane protein insertion efficiency factor YidD [Kineococcus aurantiacus]|uniref:Putative component of membrane protein insertase Oxa1/YidC/SpoIIIJ protein YidD n=1 Tax=Kineococcus aurantiacus TaxID=37633 RepID=A0A7Y9AW25_9ACTN|nr:membrane protein insertion efficiency factor YidD [Kineococcus aurantiacus]NYD21900.1 putative component of membrane protein insertase Oxa1/YidC/SpoIIIJ protein YidD [Kineococcus aurantiacus]
MNSPAARSVDWAIARYQRSLSPRKGWSCAHRVAHGGPSCSAAVRSSVRRRGVLGSLAPSALRFLACYRAALLLAPMEVQGVCCLGGIPIPFRFGGRGR